MTKNLDETLQNFSEANFLQSSAWQKVNQKVGHTTELILEDQIVSLMIIKDAKRGRYLEIPGGPLLDWQNRELTKRTFSRIKEIAKKHRCAFIRLRPQLPDTSENRRILANLGAKPAPMHLHAEHTIVIDLQKSEETLLKNMRRQTRYEVRRAKKLGIVIEKSNSIQAFKDFHQAQSETALRQHFIPPSLDDLLAERTAFGDNAHVYIAKTINGEPIAYGLILGFGTEADYFEAASTDLNRKLPGAYALQWQTIKDLKAAGYTRYNLWGIAPQGQPHHRYAKVTTFKTGFGGEHVNFVPAHDIILSTIRYLPNFIIETLRKKIRHLN